MIMELKGELKWKLKWKLKGTYECVLSCAQRITSFLTPIGDLLPFLTPHCLIQAHYGKSN